jgi:A/G-specific adenine glycosylase
MARITGRRKLSKNNTNLIISILNKWLDHNRPGDFNEAMMELGSCICIPRAPKCFDCPVKFFCRAFKNGSPLNYPKQIKKKRVPQYTFVGGLIRDKNKILIQQRDHKMLTGLWEIPNEIVDSANTSNKVLKNYIIENYGFNINVEKKLGVINHGYSHFKMKLILLDCVKTDEATKQKKEYKWINKSEIRNYPFHKVNHKIFSLINNDYWHI